MVRIIVFLLLTGAAALAAAWIADQTGHFAFVWSGWRIRSESTALRFLPNRTNLQTRASERVGARV